MTEAEGERFDYIVVGSGAGGGPLAANLALAGFKVLLLEAGGDAEGYSYHVPVFNGIASEDPELSWEYFVRHYGDAETQRRDSKFSAERDGVLYPRAGTLGGCTAHNAMITIIPHASDWDGIAEETGDESWQSNEMHRYFERLEQCTYVDPPGTKPPSLFLRFRRIFLRLLGRYEGNSGYHGFDGWLTTSMPQMTIGLEDTHLLRMVTSAAKQSRRSGFGRWIRLGGLIEHFDPNDLRRADEKPQGLVFTPLATSKGRRVSTRNRIRAVQQSHPDRLTVRLNSLVTRVVLDDNRRATGVEYVAGAHLYRADPSASGELGARTIVNATREVILAAGAFNSPQLLKLSGIGPRAELEQHGIQVRVDLPGVGENLQDRYEVGVVSEMNSDFHALTSPSFEPPAAGAPLEHALEEWAKGRGVYTSNGALCGTIMKSDEGKLDPDLFVFGLAGYFRGYYTGYSKDLLRERKFFTWAVLKAHTQNRAGSVLLQSSDPRDPPRVNFRYFDEGSDVEADDLAAVVTGIKYAREIMARASDIVRTEVVPGPDKQTDAELAQFAKDEAWGHHASCTNRIGRDDDPMAVVDSRFRVRGTTGLRVVDASVFPRIPGFFIVTAIYMLSEKASDVIIDDARRQERAAADD